MGLTNFKSAGNPFSHSSKTIGCRIYFGNKISCVVLYLILSTLAHLFLFEALGFIFCLFFHFWSVQVNILPALDHMVSLGPCLVHLATFLFYLCSKMCSQKIKPVQKGSLQFPIRLGLYLVRSGPYGPSCRISVPFLFRNVITKDQARKIKPVKKDFLQFPVCLGLYLVRLGPYVPFWTIRFVWDHVWSILPHFCSISLQKCAHKRLSQ